MLRAKAPPFVHLAPLGCGEHGGDPDSVKFCHKLGLNYVSCSPFPILEGNAIKAGTVAGANTLSYDCDGDGRADIEGFSVDPGGVKDQASEPLSTHRNPVAMP